MGEPIPSGGTDVRARPDGPGGLHELAQAFLALEHACSFYPEGHQARAAPLARLLEVLREAGRDTGEGSLVRAGDTLCWRGSAPDDQSPVVRKLAALLGTVGIGELTWSPALSAEELGRFVSRLALARAAGRRSSWEDTERYEHLRVEGPDYQALMASEDGSGASTTHLELWRALLRRAGGNVQDEVSQAGPVLPLEGWGDPALLAAELVEALGAEASAGGPEAVALVRRLAELVAQSARPEGNGELDACARQLAGVGRKLPPALRLRLFESALDQPDGGFFNLAFGALEPAEAIELLGAAFTPDPERIELLTRAFQAVFPRRLERLESVPQLREQVRRCGDPDEPLADNAWQEIEELLTGEAGDFMSAEYREQLRRLAARESSRRDGEDELARLPRLLEDLDSVHAADESLRIQVEMLHLATSPASYRETIDGLCGLCAAAFAAGDFRRGLALLRQLAAHAEGGEPLAGPAGDLQRGLRGIATLPVLQSLLPLLADGTAEERGLLAAFFSGAPEVSVPLLLDALVAGAPAAVRPEIESLLRRIGPEGASEALRRLPDAPPGVARMLLPLAVGDGGPAAAKVLLRLLERDDPRLRRDALRFLLRSDAPDARRALPALLDDPDEEIVQAVASHLGASGSPSTTRELLRDLEGMIVGGRRAAAALRAIGILSRMRAAEAIAPLGEILHRRLWLGRRLRDEVLAATVLALRRIGGDEARRLVEQAAARGPEALSALCRRQLARWDGQ